MTLDIHFLDVGQGDCTVLFFKEGGKVIRSAVIDCGGTKAFGSGEVRDDVKDEQQAGLKLLTFFEKHDVGSFDTWIITHWDKDHFGGFNYILKMAQSKSRIRRMLEDLTIYDRGECFNYSFKNTEFSSGDRTNQKTPYVTFRTLLADLKRKTEDLKNMTRLTELVFGNKNYDRKKFTLNPKPRGFKFISSEPEKDDWYRFRAPDYLVEKDLLNSAPGKKKIGASLECLVVNGWYRTTRGTTKYIDVTTLDTDEENCRSMGLLLTFDDFSCWFGGDLESEIEDTLIPVIKNRLKDRPLSLSKAGHHGSRHSTSTDFIEALQPDTLIVSSPPESTKHPHPEFLKRIAGIETLKAVYLTGCRPYIGSDERDDSVSGSVVIDGIETRKLLGLSGDVLPTSQERKFYVCGGTDHSTNKAYNGNIRVSTDGGRTKTVAYWEAFGGLVWSNLNPDDLLTDDNEMLDIESVVDTYGRVHDGVEIVHDREWSKSIRMTTTVVRKRGKKRKQEEEVELLFDIYGVEMIETYTQPKKRRLNT